MVFEGNDDLFNGKALTSDGILLRHSCRGLAYALGLKARGRHADGLTEGTVTTFKTLG